MRNYKKNKFVIRPNPLIVRWGYYLLIVLLIFISTLQEATGNIKLNNFPPTHASYTEIRESTAREKNSCPPDFKYFLNHSEEWNHSLSIINSELKKKGEGHDYNQWK